MFFTKLTAPEKAADILQEVFRFVLDKQLAAKTLKQTEADLFIALIKELNRLHDTLKENLYNFDTEKAISFTLKLIQKAVMGISVPLTGEPLQGIQVMGLLESRNLDFEEVYILGANEGNLPQTAIAPSFIPDSIRRAYGLPVIENLDAISAYMFYRLMQRSEKINIVYNTLVDESNSGEPSRFLKQLEYESGCAFNYIEHHQPVTAPLRNTVAIAKDEQVMTLLNKYLTGEKKLSASALTSYINCPLQFFYRYIAGIQEPEEISENLEANNIGSMLHYVLESFYKKLIQTDAQITKERIAAARKEIPQLAVQAFSAIMFKNEAHVMEHTGMQKVVLAIV
ncbi:MAG: PD-(D/E)XK nuclease family protein, partial [Chitinophagaceae bacterium]